MKKFILTISLLGALLPAFAQITLDGSDMPKQGMINYVYVDTLTSPDLGAASPIAQSWNYTSLLAHYPQVASFSPITPYHAYGPDFSDANMFTYGPAILYAGLYGGAPVDIGQFGYMYWKSDATGFHVVGFRTDYGIGPRNVLDAPQEMLMGAPATAGDLFMNDARWVCDFADNPVDPDTHYIRNIYKTLDCDAFGTMTTDFGTFNVLRVHENMVLVDSITYTLGSITYYGMEVYRDTSNNYHFWANDLGYPVVIVKCDVDNTVRRTEYLIDTVMGYTVTGSVFKIDEVTPIDTGEVELFTKSPIDQFFGVPETVPLVAGGHFQFSNIVPGGNFLVHARPDTSMYMYDVPTYYGDSVYWQDAATLTVWSDTSIHIHCRKDSLGYSMTGLGSISGTIYENLSGAKDMVVSGGVKVTLEQNPSGMIARHTYTDEYGKYKFEDLPSLDFVIRVDIPACPMDSTYYLSYSMGDTSTVNLDFYYDSSFIYIYNTTGVEEDELLPLGTVVYPNPFEETTYLYFTDVTPGQDCEVFLYDITGRLLDRYVGTTPYPVRIDRPEGTSGMLFYTVIVEGVQRASGKLIAR